MNDTRREQQARRSGLEKFTTRRRFVKLLLVTATAPLRTSRAMSVIVVQLKPHVGTAAAAPVKVLFWITLFGPPTNHVSGLLATEISAASPWGSMAMPSMLLLRWMLPGSSPMCRCGCP